MWGPVPIRISRWGNCYTGYYSPDGIVWKNIGLPTALNFINPRIGLTAYNSALEDKEITAYFDWFRVTPYLDGNLNGLNNLTTVAMDSNDVMANFESTTSRIFLPTILKSCAYNVLD